MRVSSVASQTEESEQASDFLIKQPKTLVRKKEKLLGAREELRIWVSQGEPGCGLGEKQA